MKRPTPLSVPPRVHLVHWHCSFESAPLALVRAKARPPALLALAPLALVRVTMLPLLKLSLSLLAFTPLAVVRAGDPGLLLVTAPPAASAFSCTSRLLALLPAAVLL